MFNNKALWLWVPAYAGTTPSFGPTACGERPERIARCVPGEGEPQCPAICRPISVRSASLARASCTNAP